MRAVHSDLSSHASTVNTNMVTVDSECAAVLCRLTVVTHNELKSWFFWELFYGR